ncbi:hypothetical protein FBULB1_7151 [Fusarium bulbicola]|nr:hypothetical protein FBULB1_7151 [Fusarium bulbicola]
MLAKESRPMLDGILFSSAMHLTNLGHLNHSALKPYRSARQKSFRGAIQTGNNHWALELAVLLCGFGCETPLAVIGTGMDLWSSKLAGCRKLLEPRLAKFSGPIDACQKCALMQFNWMVTMGKTLLIGVRPLSSLEALDCKHRDEIYSEPLDDSDMASQQQHMPDFRMHLLLREATDLAVDATSFNGYKDGILIARPLNQSTQIRWFTLTVSGDRGFFALCVTISITSTQTTRESKAALRVQSVLLRAQVGFKPANGLS